MRQNVSAIQQFREAQGLTQQDLGDRLNVTRQTISGWEKDPGKLTVLQLMRLAKALAVPVESLFEPEGKDEPPGLLFRADDSKVLTQELRGLLFRKVADYALIEKLAGEYPVLPESTPLEAFDPGLVESVANRIRDWFGVDEAPISDPLTLLEGKGLKLLRQALPAPVSGLSAFTDDWGGVIVINAAHALERQYFTSLHELGHLVFHRSEYRQVGEVVHRRGDHREKTAHYFAAAVLLPERALRQELKGLRPGWIPEVVLRVLKLKFRVSMRTVLLRAASLGLIGKKQAGQQIGILNKKYGPDAEQPELPQPDCGPRNRLEQLAYRALLAEEISISRAAEVLGQSLVDVRLRLREYVDNPLEEGVRS